MDGEEEEQHDAADRDEDLLLALTRCPLRRRHQLVLPAAEGGYLRRSTEGSIENGAVFTRTHVSRGADFIAGYLPMLGFGLNGLWAVTHGTFTPRSAAVKVTTSAGEIGQNADHG